VQVDVFNLCAQSCHEFDGIITSACRISARHDKGRAVRFKDSINAFVKLRDILFSSTGKYNYSKNSSTRYEMWETCEIPA
jgi:hypothetical protein